MSDAVHDIDEMIRLRATRVPSINQMQEWKAEIERLRRLAEHAADMLEGAQSGTFQVAAQTWSLTRIAI